MSSLLLTGPAVEPVTLAEAKTFLRVAHDDDDDVIAALIAGARVHIEAQTRRALITQTWRLTRDVWPIDGRIMVLPAPLRALSAARINKLDGTQQNIDPNQLAIDKAAAPAILAFEPGTLPISDRPVAGIELDIEASYGDAAAAVPEPLRQAIRLLIAHWYENRGVTAIGHEVQTTPRHGPISAARSRSAAPQRRPRPSSAPIRRAIATTSCSVSAARRPAPTFCVRSSSRSTIIRPR